MKRKQYTRKKRGGVKISAVIPGDTEPTIYDDAVDPFSSPETSPTQEEVMAAKEKQRRWVKETKKQREALKTAAKYKNLGTQMKTPKKNDLLRHSHKSVIAAPPSRKTKKIDTDALFAKLGALSENPVAGKIQRQRKSRKTLKKRKGHGKKKHRTKRRGHGKKKYRTKRRGHGKKKHQTKRKRGGDSDSEWETEDEEEVYVPKTAPPMSQMEKRLRKELSLSDPLSERLDAEKSKFAMSAEKQKADRIPDYFSGAAKSGLSSALNITSKPGELFNEKNRIKMAKIGRRTALGPASNINYGQTPVMERADSVDRTSPQTPLQAFSPIEL